MKEQDYIRIMDRIRNDHIENAMLWDVSAQQQNRRSIRRLSLGVGAIAACIAVVIGCIGYSVHREHLANPSGETSGAENGDQLNLFGGHGEIKCTLGNDSSILYSDDEYYYFPTNIGAAQEDAAVGGPSPDSFSYLRWEKEDGSVCEQRTYEGILLSDGEQLYTYHDGQLFITDSRGNETFFSGVPWKPCRIQKLGDDWYLLSAFLEDSWIDGNPQPYLFLDKPGEGVLQQYGNYGDVRSDGKGDTVYFRSENQIYSAPRKSPNQKTLLADAGDEPDAIADWTVDENNLYYIAVSDDGVQYRRKPLDPDAEVKGRDSINTNDHYYFNMQKSELFSVSYYYRGYEPEFRVYSTGSPIFPPGVSSAMWHRYSVTAAELWGDHLPDPDVRPDMTFFETDEYFIFTLPQEGMHGEQIVQLQKNTQDFRYLGVNYVPQETEPQETESQETKPQVTESQETKPQETEPADITNAASDLNALGGKGKLRSYEPYSLNYLGSSEIAEDDEYIYYYTYGVRARKTGGDTVFEPLNLPQIPQYNPDPEAGRNLYVSDGLVLVTDNNALIAVHPDGTQTVLLSDLGTYDIIGFIHDASGNPARLILNNYTQVNDSIVVLDLETGTLRQKHTTNYSFNDWKFVDGKLYAIGWNTGKHSWDTDSDSLNFELFRFDEDGTPIQVSTPEWKIASINTVIIEDNETIWFRNLDEEPCRGNLLNLSVTVVSEDEYSKHGMIPGTARSVYLNMLDSDAKKIIFLNHETSGEQILKEFHNPEWEIVIQGVYVENGVIHIAVSAHEYESEKLISLTVFTIDGDKISSYEITAP